MKKKSVVVVGSVKSSDIVLQRLIKANVLIKRVYSLDERYADGVSGYYPIHQTARDNGIPFQKFRKINDPEIIKELETIHPDYIFVVGLSQLISKAFLDCAIDGVIGLHPAPLPQYRGRAALVWQMLLGEKRSAVSFFFIDEGVDSGDIIVQEVFEIKETDYAIDVDNKGLEATIRGIDKVAKMISDGKVIRIKQDESKATYLLRRTPEDGEINWLDSIETIHRLIRAVSAPYPGAFSYYDGNVKIKIWRADIIHDSKFIGIPGQICESFNDGFDVICTDGVLHVYDYEIEEEAKAQGLNKLIVGHKLKGYIMK